MHTIIGAMNDMADAMTAVNASRRQAGGVAGWRDLVAAAVAAGIAAGAAHAGRLAVPARGSRTHARWLATADAVIVTLDGHAAEAEAAAGSALEAAAEAREEQQRAEAGRAQAEADEQPGPAAAYAAAAQAAAEEAELAEGYAAACETWAAAASEASGYGVALTRREDAIHAPVGTAIADAGGGAWIAEDKHFITSDGGA